MLFYIIFSSQSVHRVYFQEETDSIRASQNISLTCSKVLHRQQGIDDIHEGVHKENVYNNMSAYKNILQGSLSGYIWYEK